MNETEYRKYARYIGGLGDNLQHILNHQDIWRISQPYQRAKAPNIGQGRGVGIAANNSYISSCGVTSKGPSQDASSNNSSCTSKGEQRS